MPARPSPQKQKSEGTPPRPPRGKGARGTRDDDDEVGADVEISGPARAAPSGDEDDATKGEWLFKQNDMVLGPVTAIVLVERIKQGELSADTPIARDGQPFKPMKLVPLFRETHEAMLEAKKREQEERAYNAAVSRARFLRVVIFAVIILVPAVAGAVAGRIVMIKQPWDKTADWIAKAPPLVDLPPRPPEIKKAEPPPPVVASNDDGGKDEAEKDEPTNGGGKRVAKADKGKKDDKNDKNDKNDKKDDGKSDKADKADSGGGDKGFVKELTNEQAVAPLKDAPVRSALGSCLKAELESNPDMPGQVTLSYTITEAGKAANVEITNRELRGRPIQDCVKGALAQARWPRFEGERKNVSVPFNIKKPPKPPGAK
jgi:hypothetical protein